MTTVPSKTRAFAIRLSAGLSILALAALSSSPAFAAQGLTLTAQEGGFLQALNNAFGLSPAIWQAVMIVSKIFGIGAILAGFFLLYIRYNNPQKKSQISLAAVAVCIIVGSLCLGLSKFANMGATTFLGSDYNSQSIQQDNSNPFN